MDQYLFPVSTLAYLSATVVASLASVVDLKMRRVPNWLTIMTASLGLAYASLVYQLGGLVIALSGLFVALGLLLPGFLLGFTGGGDVKLFASFGCFLGPKLTIFSILIYYPIAAIFVLIYIVHLRIQRHFLIARKPEIKQHFKLDLDARNCCHKSLLKKRLPMAPAIACSVILAPLLCG